MVNPEYIKNNLIRLDPNPRLRNFFLNREPREPRERFGFFAWFGYFAVLSAFWIGMDFESPYFPQSLLVTARIRRGFGA